MTTDSTPDPESQLDPDDTQEAREIDAGRVEDLPVAPSSGQPTGADQAAANQEDDPPS
jgi:hypothetical protein